MPLTLTSRRWIVLGLLIMGGGAALFYIRRILPSRAAASCERGTQLAAAQLPLDARAAFLEAIRLDPAYAPPYRALAEMASSQRFYDIAVGYWKEYIAREPAKKHTRCQLAYA